MLKSKGSSFGLRTWAIGSSFLRMLPVFLVAVVALVLVYAALGRSAEQNNGDTIQQPSRQASAQVRSFAAADVFFQFNATERDIGIHGFFDAEGWKQVRIVSPDGRIFEVAGKGSLKEIGFTELMFESVEPSIPEDLTLEQFLALFPAGKYKFFGTTVEGDRLVGTDRLTHRIPDAPTLVSPKEGEEVDPDATFIVDWKPVTGSFRGPSGIEIVGYQVIVERENPLRTFSVDLPPSTTKVQVPPEFLEPGTEYTVEVLAIEASGNRTITESSFTTLP
jgi:hypothetical protein